MARPTRGKGSSFPPSRKVIQAELRAIMDRTEFKQALHGNPAENRQTNLELQAGWIAQIAAAQAQLGGNARVLTMMQADKHQGGSRIARSEICDSIGKAKGLSRISQPGGWSRERCAAGMRNARWKLTLQILTFPDSNDSDVNDPVDSTDFPGGRVGGWPAELGLDVIFDIAMTTEGTVPEAGVESAVGSRSSGMDGLGVAAGCASRALWGRLAAVTDPRYGRER